MATNNQDLMKILGEISDTLAGLSKSLAETYPPGTQIPSSISDPLKALLGGFSSGLGSYTQPKTTYPSSSYSAPKVSNSSNLYSAPSAPYSTPTIAKSQPSTGGNIGIKVTKGYQPLSFGVPGSLDTTIPTFRTTPSYISKPVSGMANEIVSPNDKKGKSNQEQIVTQFLANQKVPTRQSLWDTIKGMLGTPSPEQSMGGVFPKATPVIEKLSENKESTNITPPANVPSPAQQGLTTEQYQQGIGSHPTTTSPMGGIYNQYTSDKTSTQINLGGKEKNPEFAPINDMTTQLLDLIKQSTLTATQILEEASKAALNPETTQEDIQKMVEQAQTTAQNLTPAIQPIISQLDVIDKAIADASIGFRKAAEDIRNNPDISVWQQDRRLRELDDLQNYAPLLYGLSLKDLINYRSQLADKVNYWTTQYNNIFDKAMGLVDTSTPAERLERSAQFSTKALEQLQGLAALLIPTYSYQEYTDNYGNVIRITYKTDPVTGQQTEVGRVNLGPLGQGLSAVLKPSGSTGGSSTGGGSTGGNNETGGGSIEDIWERIPTQ